VEQRLDATYLRPGPFERAAAVAIVAMAIGTGILLAAWGISFLWRYTPPEIAVRIANPEVRVAQSGPLTVTQERPFIVVQSEPFKVEQPPSPMVPSGVGADAKTATGDVIRREVTVFSNVKHGPGTVVTGWNYSDGSGGVPVRQYCYYSAFNVDYSITRIDIASDRARLSNASLSLVPELEGALAKCQWWPGFPLSVLRCEDRTEH
jgi:hypothetical protein